MRVSLIFALFLLAAADTAECADDHRTKRRAMMAKVAETAATLPAGAKLDLRVLEAMAQVRRHRFVPDKQQDAAYEDRPLPIGYGQTISQPSLVAFMTSLLALEADHRVLEVGTGSGYQAAIAARLVEAVYTIEIIPPLAESAAERLATLGYDNVSVRQGDGYYGWPEHAPFDAVIVTAAASHVPPPLVEQLKPGGRMVIPVGARVQTQFLLLVEKDTEGKVKTRSLLPVRFVPLTGRH